MRNVLVLGSGRSGTSMVAGTLAQAGWFVGAHPYPAREANPKGFFESPDVNGINEYLLAQVTPAAQGLADWQHWLARLPDGVQCSASRRIDERIARLVQQRPFCFKDPRLCYTLPVWRKALGDTAFLCVFRHPAATARSMLKECAEADYLRGVDFDLPRALDVWQRMYRRVLDEHSRMGDWLFLHYEQVLTSEGLDRIERFVGGAVARQFPESNLRHQQADEGIPADIAGTYAELCDRAGQRASARVVPTNLVRPLPTSVTLFEAAARSVPGGHGAKNLDEFETAIRSATRSQNSLRARPLLDLRALRDEDLEYIDGRWPRIAAWERLVAEWGGMESRQDESSEVGGMQRQMSQTLALALRELAQVFAREERIAMVDELERARSQSATAAEDLRPWPIASTAAQRVLAWPDWSETELVDLLERHQRLVQERGALALCLRFDVELDGDRGQALQSLQRAYERVCAPGTDVEVVVLAEELSGVDVARVGAAIEGWIALASSRSAPRAAWLERLAARPIAAEGTAVAR